MENENKNSGEISRRQFAKNMALAGMGALSGVLNSPLSAMADQEEKIQKARRENTNTVKGKPYFI